MGQWLFISKQKIPSIPFIQMFYNAKTAIHIIILSCTDLPTIHNEMKSAIVHKYVKYSI